MFMGNTTNLFQHLHQRHAGVCSNKRCRCQLSTQSAWKEAGHSLCQEKVWWQAITDAVTYYITKDMVKNTYLCVPSFTIPSSDCVCGSVWMMAGWSRLSWPGLNGLWGRWGWTPGAHWTIMCRGETSHPQTNTDTQGGILHVDMQHQAI